jgi:hypothetical protein
MSDLGSVIGASPVIVRPELYCVVKMRTPPASLAGHFMVAQDENETTVITTEAGLCDLAGYEDAQFGYRLMEIQVATPFETVGFLAAVCRALADAGLSILVVSTYSCDYVLLKAAELADGLEALRRLRFPVQP